MAKRITYCYEPYPGYARRRVQQSQVNQRGYTSGHPGASPQRSCLVRTYGQYGKMPKHRTAARRTIQIVLRFWLTYCDLARRPLSVIILDSPSLPLARLQAAAEGLDQGATFCDGHELDGDSALLVPPDAIGRMLSLDEARKIIRRIEQWIPKQAAAASTSRRCGRPAKILILSGDGTRYWKLKQVEGGNRISASGRGIAAGRRLAPSATPRWFHEND